LIIVLLGFLFFIAGLEVAEQQPAGFLAFFLGPGIAVILWLVGAIFIFIGRKAFIAVEKE